MTRTPSAGSLLQGSGLPCAVVRLPVLYPSGQSGPISRTGGRMKSRDEHHQDSITSFSQVVVSVSTMKTPRFTSTDSSAKPSLQ
ncbi:Tubulin beta chain [Giardia duodenalis assemblage B]|uniref:Tubulin beta chain n=1 Tax=Giardia duodenalis assemblage B TaxID=1394984 RepID=A0A132NMB3_GIAIN|nr:Tubulin beta chain [Giardia intestinalis assemblage B]